MHRKAHMTEILKADLSVTKHADAILYLLDQYALDPMGGSTGLSEYTLQNLISVLRTRPGIYIYIAFVNNQPAGLINGMEGFSTFACKHLINIHDLTVLKEFRGRGIATELLQAMEKKAHELGCCKLTLEVLEGNKVAQSVYTHYGFGGYELDPQQGQALFWEKKI